MAESTQSPAKFTDSSIDDLKQICLDEHLTLYAILDACDEPQVPVKVQELGAERAVSLYRGAAERDYWSFAPYLAIVDQELLNWIVENLWEDPWGIFAVSAAPLNDVRKHFRQFLLVESPDGEQLYFRFYDPRVLPTYLESSNAEECQQMYNIVTDYYVGGSTAESLIRISI